MLVWNTVHHRFTSTLALHHTQHTDLPWHNCPPLAIRRPYLMLTARLKLTSLFWSLLVSLERSVSFLYRKVLAALTSEAVRIVTLLSVVALCYSIIEHSACYVADGGPQQCSWWLDIHVCGYHEDYSMRSDDLWMLNTPWHMKYPTWGVYI